MGGSWPFARGYVWGYRCKPLPYSAVIRMTPKMAEISGDSETVYYAAVFVASMVDAITLIPILAAVFSRRLGVVIIAAILAAIVGQIIVAAINLTYVFRLDNFLVRLAAQIVIGLCAHGVAQVVRRRRATKGAPIESARL